MTLQNSIFCNSTDICNPFNLAAASTLKWLGLLTFSGTVATVGDPVSMDPLPPKAGPALAAAAPKAEPAELKVGATIPELLPSSIDRLAMLPTEK